MKLPGRAWLEFEVTPCAGGSQIRQTAIFDPLGLFGLIYWYGISPLHFFVFAGMLRNIARAAKNTDEKNHSAHRIHPVIEPPRSDVSSGAIS